MNSTANHTTNQELQQEIDVLRYQLQVAEDTLEAIRNGSVDALAVQENGVTKIFTLEGAEQTYRVLVENMSEGAVTLNQQGIILYCNSQFAKLVNLNLSEIIGYPFARFVPGDYRQQFQDLFTKAWGQHAKSEFILQPPAHDLVHVYISLTVIADKGEEVLGMIITNLSDQKELQRLTSIKEELFKKNEELLRINNDLDTFVYTASHDLKNPIINIEGLVTVLKQVLLEDAPEAETEIIFGHIHNSISRFKTTILDLSDVAKVERNFSDSLDTINCQEIIEEVQAGLSEMILRTQAEVTLQIIDCLEIKFSKKNFQSIVYNLLSNAVKYRSPDRAPVILIKLEKCADFNVLSVRDNGLGINLKDKAKVFFMFKRLHDHIEGSGIGLYIVKRIMDNAGGKIEVDSELGEGSVFKLYFKI